MQAMEWKNQLAKTPYLVMFVLFGVIATMAIVSSVNFDSTFSDTKFDTSQIPTSEEKTLATPTTTLVKSEKIIVTPQETDMSDSTKSYLISPKISTYSKDSSTLKIMNPAFAIPASDVDVTLDVWSIPGNGGQPHELDVTSTDVVYFLEGSSDEITSLNSSNVFKEWDLPSNLSGSGQVAVNSTDSIFFLLTADDVIGHLKPSTNLFTIWNFSGSQINGIKVDSSGNVYFGDSTGLIKRLNPSTNVVTTWDPSFLISVTRTDFDSNGLVYFTSQAFNMIGRLNPNTDEMIKWTLPTSESVPVGLSIDLSNRPVVAEFIGNKIARLDPTNDMVTEWDVPTSSASTRDVVVDSNGIIYFTESSVDKIGRLDPSADIFTEWTIPSVSNFRGIGVDDSDQVYVPDFSSKIIRLR